MPVKLPVSQDPVQYSSSPKRRCTTIAYSSAMYFFPSATSMCIFTSSTIGIILRVVDCGISIRWPHRGGVIYWFTFSTESFALFKHSCKYNRWYVAIVCVSMTNEPSYTGSTCFLAFSTSTPKKLIWRWLYTVSFLQLYLQLKTVT
jgi:hypothetical protein